jgi:hypothetical protein
MVTRAGRLNRQHLPVGWSDRLSVVPGQFGGDGAKRRETEITSTPNRGIYVAPDVRTRRFALVQPVAPLGKRSSPGARRA